jgi:hypothetical protein
MQPQMEQQLNCTDRGCRRAFSFDGTVKFEYHHCRQAQSPVAVPELWR